MGISFPFCGKLKSRKQKTPTSDQPIYNKYDDTDGADATEELANLNSPTKPEGADVVEGYKGVSRNISSLEEQRVGVAVTSNDPSARKGSKFFDVDANANLREDGWAPEPAELAAGLIPEVKREQQPSRGSDTTQSEEVDDSWKVEQKFWRNVVEGLRSQRTVSKLVT